MIKGLFKRQVVQRQIARGMRVPVQAQSVLSPMVCYDIEAPKTGIYFATEDDRHGRVTFEKLDSIRISRGEYGPFEDDWVKGTPFCWVYIVENSSWLAERYAYESKYYGDSYGFDVKCSVDEMLTDFSHYLFRFHDEFVEVTAAGIWFEIDDKPFDERDLTDGHPFLPLPQSALFERIEVRDLVCDIRKNQATDDELKEYSRYCGYPIMDFVLDLPDSPAAAANPSFRLTLRNKNGKLSSRLNRSLGGEIVRLDGVASLDEIRPYIVQALAEISARRHEIGK